MSGSGSSGFEAVRAAVERLLPGDAGEELKRNIDATLRGHFEQMNLVTRDQLEVQEKILRRSRERIAELEQRVASLEEALEQQSTNG